MGEAGLDPVAMARFAGVIRDLMSLGRRVVVVTSGAVGAGRWRLGLNPRSIPEKQAAAAVGQGILMHRYDQALSAHGLTVAQLLLTRADFGDRPRYLNFINMLATLLSQPGIVPIVNENDSVAVEELRFGDNDTLSAMVASAVDAHSLFILSDVDGLYDADPAKSQTAKKLARISAITPDIEALAGGSASVWGTGGMATKISAAKMATSCGIPVVLLHAREPQAIVQCLSGGQAGTLFVPVNTRLEGRKRWLAWGGVTTGRLVVDRGAARAVSKEGRSLLPAGVLSVHGDFVPGDLVALCTPDDSEFARGLVNYSSADLSRICGRRSTEISAILGYKPYDEAVHRSNLVMR